METWTQVPTTCSSLQNGEFYGHKYETKERETLRYVITEREGCVKKKPSEID